MTQACSKKVITRRYYVLDSPSTADSLMNIEPLTNAICEILPVSVPPAYAQHRIAVRKRSHEITYYQYHHWAISPSTILTNLLEGQLRSASIFMRIATSPWRELPDYQVSTTVYRIEAYEEEDDFYARFDMRLELVENQNKKIVSSHQFSRSVFLEERDLNLLASTLSSIFYEEVSIFSDKIKIFFAEQK
jgi:ABC-type uncharacterized transport system auxiliary subunit